MDSGLITAACLGLMCLLQLIAVAALLRAGRPLREMSVQAQAALTGLTRTLGQLEALLNELRQSGIVARASAAVDSVSGGAGKLDPLAAELAQTLTEARGMLDDATQTSQAVRGRVEDFAATQRELTELTRALADVACELRDKELAGKLANVLSDTSLLAADLGVLAENATSIIEGGKPLVSGISRVVDSAKSRAAGLAQRVGSVREGIRAGSEAWREGGK